MSKRPIVPDSTFYVCFLDDIQKPEYIVRILENDHFEFFTGSVIKGEIEESKHYHLVKDVVDHRVQLFIY